MANIKIHNPKLEDWFGIQIIAIKCLPRDITSYITFLHLLQSSLWSRETLVAHINKRTVGYISTIPLSKKYAFLHQFSVIPEQRKKGIGRKLIIKMLELLRYNGYKKVRLRVSTRNINAISYYTDLDFKIIGTALFKKRYIMEKVI
jgi:ribosomal protein S18 acetylase RimI-like enzyme